LSSEKAVVKPALTSSDEHRLLRAFGVLWNTLSARSSPFLDHFCVQVYARKFLELARTFGAVTFAALSSAELAALGCSLGVVSGSLCSGGGRGC
jgi:hypothetical protein